MADKWPDDPKSFEHMRENFTTAFRVNGVANMNLPDMAEKLCQMRDEIDHLRAQLRDAGVHPMGEFICACGVRKGPPNENEPKF